MKRKINQEKNKNLGDTPPVKKQEGMHIFIFYSEHVPVKFKINFLVF